MKFSGTFGNVKFGSGTFTSLDVGDGNITNVGNIALDSISAVVVLYFHLEIGRLLVKFVLI